MLKNDYQKVIEVGGRLFAVQMTDGGWTVADGPGTSFTAPDDDEVAGYHLPVRFQTESEAVEAIKSGPDAMFDIAPDCEWAIHCIERGGVLTDAYKLEA